MIEPLCRDCRCIIVGSAPGVTLPEPLPGDVVLGANGGAAIARDAGREVHVLCTTTFLFRPDCARAEFATLEALRGLSVQSIWVDEQHGPASFLERKLEALRIGYERMQGVSPEARRSLVAAAVGEPIRVSTGVFAACLAVASGASGIVVCGIDPWVAGHEGMPWDEARRDHVLEDARALEAIA